MSEASETVRGMNPAQERFMLLSRRTIDWLAAAAGTLGLLSVLTLPQSLAPILILLIGILAALSLLSLFVLSTSRGRRRPPLSSVPLLCLAAASNALLITMTDLYLVVALLIAVLAGLRAAVRLRTAVAARFGR